MSRRLGSIQRAVSASLALALVVTGRAAAAQEHAAIDPAPGVGHAVVLDTFRETILGSLANTLSHDARLDLDGLKARSWDVCSKLLLVRDPNARVSEADRAYANLLAASAWNARGSRAAAPPPPAPAPARPAAPALPAAPAPPPAPAPSPAPSPPPPPAPAPRIVGDVREYLKAVLEQADGILVQTEFNNRRAVPTAEQREAELREFARKKPVGRPGGGTFLDAYNAATKQTLTDFSQLDPEDAKTVDVLIREVLNLPPDAGGPGGTGGPDNPPSKPQPDVPTEITEVVVDVLDHVFPEYEPFVPLADVAVEYLVPRLERCRPFRRLRPSREYVGGGRYAPRRGARARYIIVDE